MPVPPFLRAWFILHFVVDLAFALPLLIVPELVLPLLGWTSLDPVSPRLVGAALLAIGVVSLRERDASFEVYRALLQLKVIWSTAAIFGLTVAIARGAPSLTWLFLSIFLVFAGVWAHYAVRMRQYARAPKDDDAQPDSDDDGENGSGNVDPSGADPR